MVNAARMEKRNENGFEDKLQEGLQIQCPEVSQVQAVGSNGLQSNKKSQKSEGAAQNDASKMDVAYETQKMIHQEEELEQNIALKNSLQKSEANVTTRRKCMEFEEELEQEPVVLVQQKVEEPADSLVIPEQFYIQTNQPETYDKTPIGFDLFAVDTLKSERNLTVQERAVSTENIVIAPVQDSIQTVQQGMNGAIQQTRNSMVDNELVEGNEALQQKSETLTKLFIVHSKLGQPFKISEGDVEVPKQEIVTQQGSVEQEVSQTLVETGATEDESSIKAQQLRELLANFFRQPNQINGQQTNISCQGNTDSTYNSEKIEPQELEGTMTSGESKYNWNIFLPELGKDMIKCSPESGDSVPARSEESVVTQIPVNHNKHYITLRPLQFRVRRSSENSNDIFMPPSQSKGYITVHPAKQKDNSSESGVHVLSQPLQETVSAPQTPTHIFWPLPPLQQLGPAALKNILRTSKKTKPSSESQTPIFLPAGTLQQIGSKPVTQTQVHMPPRTFQESASTSKTPNHEQEPSLSFPSKIRSSRDLTLQRRRHSPEPQHDNLPLVPLEEVPHGAPVIIYDRIRRNGRNLGALLPSLRKGIHDCTQWICERHSLSPERRSFFQKLTVVFCSVFGAGIVGAGLYFIINCSENKNDTGGTNVTSLLTDFHVNLNKSA